VVPTGETNQRGNDNGVLERAFGLVKHSSLLRAIAPCSLVIVARATVMMIVVIIRILVVVVVVMSRWLNGVIGSGFRLALLAKTDRHPDCDDQR